MIIRLTAALSLWLAASTNAQSPMTDVSCDDSTRLTQNLKMNWGAERRGMGLRDPETVLEIWVARDGDWIIVQNYSNGTSCIVAMGQHWEGDLLGPA